MSVAFPRSSKTLLFVRKALSQDPDDTITRVMPPPKPKPRARKPPKARTTNEAALPSIMITQESWAPPVPRDFTRMQHTVVRRPRKRPPADVPSTPSLAPRRKRGLFFAAAAIVLGLVGIYLVPLFSRIFDTAFSALNR